MKLRILNIFRNFKSDKNPLPSAKKINLLVEWTSYCNITCNICPIDSLTMRKPGHMAVELWEKILDDCKQNGHYVNWVHHIGEPLLWKHFEKGMELWRESGLSALGHISTNGILLDEDKIEIINNTGIDFIRICIDTLRPDVYRKIRNNDYHDVVVKNIKMALDKAPTLKVQLQLMRTKLNEDETPKDYFDFFGKKENCSVFYTTAMDVGKRSDIILMTDEKLDPSLCNKVDYEHCVIGWDGSVGLCCADYWIANRLGNIADATIADIFDGPFANKMRQMIRAKDLRLAPACLTCSMDHMKSPIRRLISSDEE